MGGTIVCGVTDTREGRAAAQLALALAERLRLRLVLAHAVDAPRRPRGGVAGVGPRAEAERALGRIARELGAGDAVELRVETGDSAELLAWVAAEKDAAFVVLGSRARRFRRLGCSLAGELRTRTPAPVLVAPPQTRRRSARRLAAVEAAAAG